MNAVIKFNMLAPTIRKSESIGLTEWGYLY